MTTAPRNLPRFLPTLTEVVRTAASVQPAAVPASELDLIATDVMQRMRGLIEQRLAQEIDDVLKGGLEEQLQTLRLRLWQEIETDVREAVVEAITRRAPAQS